MEISQTKTYAKELLMFKGKKLKNLTECGEKIVIYNFKKAKLSFLSICVHSSVRGMCVCVCVCVSVKYIVNISIIVFLL